MEKTATSIARLKSTNLFSPIATRPSGFNMKKFVLQLGKDNAVCSILEENGYSLEQSIGGSWRLMRDDVLIYDDPACEDLNEDEATAVAFFTGYFKEYVKSYSMDYENYHVNITEDSEYYHIDFCTGLGEAHYLKSDWTLEEALKDQAEM